MIMDSESRAQTGHRNSLCLLYNVLGLLWEDVKAGSDLMAKDDCVAEDWNYSYIWQLMLLVGASAGQNLHMWALSMHYFRLPHSVAAASPERASARHFILSSSLQSHMMSISPYALD